MELFNLVIMQILQLILLLYPPLDPVFFLNSILVLNKIFCFFFLPSSSAPALSLAPKASYYMFDKNLSLSYFSSIKLWPD